MEGDAMTRSPQSDIKRAVSLDGLPIPYSGDIERQVIADCVNSPEGFNEYRRIVKEEHFSDPENRTVWNRLNEMFDRGEELSIIALGSIVGNPYLNQILDKPAASELEALGHCGALAGVSRRRSMYVNSLELLKAASLNHLEADEQTKAFERLSEAFNENGTGNNWRRTVFDFTTNVTQPEPLLSCCGVPIATIENLTVISGKPKVCKTTLQSSIIAACLAGRSIMNIEPASPFLKILVCDTEQSPYYLSKQCDRIFRMAGIEKGNEGKGALVVLNLRPYPPQERIAFIKKAVEDYKPDLLFIDGSADLVEDTNDLQSSERLVADLLTLSSKYNLGIITIVHSNPGGEGKVRGHLGSCLERKAETVITLERDGMSDRIKVKPRQTRNKPFEAFIITLDDQGDPELVSPDESPRTAEDWLLFLMEPGKEYRNRDLVEMVVNKGYGRTTVQHAITSALQHGRINKKGDFYMIELTGNVEDIPDG